MLRKPLLHSTRARLSLAFGGIVLAAMLAAGVIIGFRIEAEILNRIREGISREFEAVAQEARDEGLEVAARNITARDQPAGSMDYLMSGPQGQILAGHHMEMNGPDGFREVTAKRRSIPGAVEQLLVLSGDVGGGVRLSVGDDIGHARAALGVVFETTLEVGLLALLACFAAGYYASRLALQRVSKLNATMERVAAGDMSARYRGFRQRTDVDDIGVGVNGMLDDIDKLIASLKRVSQDLAHDLRTPLSHLRQRLAHARDAENLDAKSIAISFAEDKIEEILRMVDAILRFNELDTGVVAIRSDLTKPAAILEQVVDAYAPDIEHSGRAMVLGAVEEGWIRGDPELLSMAVANLLENAMRHTPVGASILASCARCSDGFVIEITDNGPGVPAESREFVLKPFSRLDPSRSQRGSGIGLSIVAAIIRRHGARLVLDDARPGLAVRLIFAEVSGPRDLLAA